MSRPKPRNILEECYENIERELQAHCTYLAVQEREVKRHGKQIQDADALKQGFQQAFTSLLRFCQTLLGELRQARRENVELTMENERLKAEVSN